MALAPWAHRLLAVGGRISSVGRDGRAPTATASTLDLPATPPHPAAIRRRLRLPGILLVLTILPGLAGCGSRTPIEQARLLDGGQGSPATVQELLARSDTVAVFPQVGEFVRRAPATGRRTQQLTRGLSESRSRLR